MSAFDPQSATVRDFITRWCARESPNWTTRHYEDTKAVLRRHIIPSLGQVKANALTPAAILAFRAQLAHYVGRRGKGYSASRINSIMGLVRIVCTEISVALGTAHPFGTIRRLPKNAPPPRPFDAQEVEQLLEHVEPHYRNYLIARLFTAMHGNELEELMWDQVDLEQCVIHVQGGPPRKRGRGRPTYTGTRDVPMNARVEEAFRLQLRRRQPRQLFVFAAAGGGRIDPGNFSQRVWLPMLQELGMADRSQHDLRHTAIAQMLQSGTDLRIVAQCAGHTSVESLVRLYGHYIPKVAAAA